MTPSYENIFTNILNTKMKIMSYQKSVQDNVRVIQAVHHVFRFLIPTLLLCSSTLALFVPLSGEGLLERVPDLNRDDGTPGIVNVEGITGRGVLLRDRVRVAGPVEVGKGKRGVDEL